MVEECWRLLCGVMCEVVSVGVERRRCWVCGFEAAQRARPLRSLATSRGRLITAVDSPSSDLSADLPALLHHHPIPRVMHCSPKWCLSLR